MIRNSPSRPQKLSAYVLWRALPLAVIAMGVIGLMVLSTTEKTIKETVNERIRHQSDYVEERINQRLNTIHDELSLLAENDLIVNGLIDAESRNLYLPTFFVSLRLGGGFVARISLVDYKGRKIFDNGLPGGPTIDHEEWVDALSIGEDVHHFDIDGLLVAVPVMVHGYPEGAMVASFAPETASKVFDTGTSGVEVDLIDSKGRTLFSSIEHDTEEKHDQGGYHNPDRWIENRHSIPFLPGIEVLTAQRKSEAYGTIQQLRTFLIYTSLATLAALVGAIVYSTYLSSRELGRLSSLLGGIARPEHFMHRIKIKETGPAEVRSLSTAFNTMLETLQQTTTSRSYLDNILNSLNEILIVTSQGGDIITLNTEAEKFLVSRGLTKEDNISTAIRAECFGVDQDPWEFLRITGGMRSLEGIYVFPDSSMKALLWTKSPVMDEDGFETGMVYVASDITERMQMDQMKTEFVSTVSHELRTPLTSILGSIKLVQSGATGTLPDKAESMLTIAQNNSERLVRLINDILDVQKIEAGQLEIENEPLEVGGRISNAVSENDAYAKEFDVTYKVTLPGEELWIAADAHRLDQVLANLMSNAAKFSDPGSDVHIGVASESGAVTLSVADSGAGIPESHHESIFEKFKQVDASDSRSKGGTGLGLAITKDLVKMMSGEIWFDSTLGEGTTFYVRFPEVASPAAQHSEKSLSA